VIVVSLSLSSARTRDGFNPTRLWIYADVHTASAKTLPYGFHTMYNPELGVCLVLSSSSPCFTHPIDFKLLCVSCLFLLIRPVEQPSLLRNRSSRNQEDLLLKDISTWLAKCQMHMSLETRTYDFQ
jgi:hypothetical protein